MRHRLVAALALLAGCGGGSAALASSGTTPSSETTLGLRTTPRDEQDDVSGRGQSREVVRIGGAREARVDESEPAEEPSSEGESAEDERDELEGSRPVLRLHGVPRPLTSAEGIAPYPGSAPPESVPAPPSVTAFGRLPPMITPDVPAIPEQPLEIEAPDAPRGDDAIVREYQAALSHVEARRFDEALRSLARFALAHPEHSYADNALYWQGEVHYARREYRDAIEVLERMVERYPDGNKVPDALVRIGDAFEHLGDRARARAYFRRVREQYPDSLAARTASREET